MPILRRAQELLTLFQKLVWWGIVHPHYYPKQIYYVCDAPLPNPLCRVGQLLLHLNVLPGPAPL